MGIQRIRGTVLAAAIIAGLLQPVLALQLPKSKNFRGRFDTNISYGVTFRAADRDSRLIGAANGGEAGGVNGDDGDLNYDKGDAVYNVIKVTHDLDLNYKNYGAFVRGSYYYDFANRTRESLGEQARNRTGRYAEFLDAYVRGSVRMFNNDLTFRLGQQAVNWGESSFIQNGINVVNPVDLAKLRVPGSEIKEALLPTPMAWASQSFGKMIALEGFVLADFDKVRTDPRGTYFSPDDLVSDDSNKIFVGSGRRNDEHQPPTDAFFFPPLTAATNTGQVWGSRTGDRNADDSGQAGIALRVLAPILHNTEFGFYHMNYHSRVPFISGVRGGVSVNNPATADPFAPCGGATPYINFPGIGPGGLPDCTGTPATYFAEYPENIRLYGASFNTQGPWGWAIQGEHSYRPNQPVQYTVSEVALAAGGLATYFSGNNALAAALVPDGTEIKGYERLDVHQSQITLSKILGPFRKLDQVTVAGEVGYTHMNLQEGRYYHGPGVTLAPGTNPGTGVNTLPIQGQATKDSWGYRLITRLDFLDTFFQTNMSPRVVYSEDVNGVSSTFVEGNKAISFGFTTTYKTNWALDLSYANFFGGREFKGATSPAGTFPAGQPAQLTSFTNQAGDRDFYSFNLSYSF